MQVLVQYLYLNIIYYHGCQVRQGCITSLILNQHSNNLKDYLKYRIRMIDKEPFIKALKLAINHLHSLSQAYNNLNTTNILVNEVTIPVLIDFNSSYQICEKLTTSRGTKGWIDEDIGNYTTSETHYNISALGKIHAQLYEPTFEDQLAWYVLQNDSH